MLIYWELLCHSAHCGGCEAGAVRIGTNAVTKEKISYCSFKNTDGSYALVVTNGNDTKQPITIVEGNHQFNYTIPANAVASFRWQEQR